MTDAGGSMPPARPTAVSNEPAAPMGAPDVPADAPVDAPSPTADHHAARRAALRDFAAMIGVEVFY